MTQPPTVEPIELSATADRDDAVEVVPARQPDAHGFHFKVRSSGRIYRLDAARDPHLPRFWCFRISRCAASGTVDLSERPWFGGDRMTREDLPEAVAAIRAAPGDWLALPQNGELRRWVLEDAPADASPRKLPPSKLSQALAE
jgi:hypothetical protein